MKKKKKGRKKERKKLSKAVELNTNTDRKEIQNRSGKTKKILKRRKTKHIPNHSN